MANVMIERIPSGQGYVVSVANGGLGLVASPAGPDFYPVHVVVYEGPATIRHAEGGIELAGGEYIAVAPDGMRAHWGYGTE